MSKIKDFRHKILIINVEDKKQTQEEIEKLGLDKMKIRATFTANNNLVLYVKDKYDAFSIIHSNDFLIGKKNKY